VNSMPQRKPPSKKPSAKQPSRSRPIIDPMALVSFPARAHWNAKLVDAVEFEIGLGEYQGVVRVDRRVFRHLLGEPATPARCIEITIFSEPSSSVPPRRSSGVVNWPMTGTSN
jgi:hypothetical protein